MSERRRKAVLGLLSVFSFVVLLRGCGDPHNYTSEQAEQYLEERYGADFTLSETVIETNTTATAGTATTYVSFDPKHYYFHDENDIPCTFDMTAEYGCMGNRYYVTEDYQLQWLKQHSDVYRSLTEEGFVFDADSCGLRRDIADYEEIEPLCREVFSVLRKEEALVPDSGSPKEWDVYARRPLIRLNYGEDSSCTLFFRTNENDLLTDEEVFTYRFKCLYADMLREKGVKDRPDIVPLSQLSIYKDGEALDVKMINKDMTYYTSDRISKSGWFRLDNAEAVFRGAGLKVSKWRRNKLVVKNGDDTVEIIRRRKNNTVGSVEVEILKNGEPCTVEGGKDGAPETVKGEVSVYPVYKFTTSDYANIFGITFDYDFEGGKADIR